MVKKTTTITVYREEQPYVSNVVEIDATQTQPEKKRYTIQLMALTRNFVKPSYFKNLNNVKLVRCNDGYVRYLYGNYPAKYVAKKFLKEVQEKGYPKAFIRDYIQE